MAECVAEPLSRKDIRRMANLIRLIEGSANELYFDIVHFLEVTLPRVDEGFSLVVKTKSEMGECHGLSYQRKLLVSILQ